jgi:hypothetical protein
VKDVFTAAGISEDQSATLGGFNLLDDGLTYCKGLCESSKEGELCSEDEDNQCTVGLMFDVSSMIIILQAKAKSFLILP